MYEGDESTKCVNCGALDAIYAPDPFNHEMYGNETPVWECPACRFERAMEI